MGQRTNIEWADSTINPTTGCEGCELWGPRIRTCYAGNLHETRLAKSLPALYAENFQEVRLDLRASSKDERNHSAYRQVVDLEIASAFSFQQSRWLGDVRPDLLTHEQVAGVERAKEIAQGRREIEARIPKALRFVKGWPTFIPSTEQCALLAEVRQAIGSLTRLPTRFTDAHSVRARYAELYAQKLCRG